MEAGLAEFVKIYAKDNKLSEIEVAMYAGALSAKAIEKLDKYKNFVLILSSVAPHLIHYTELAGKDNE